MHRLGYASPRAHVGETQQNAELISLVTAASEGDELAWRRLWLQLEPRLLGLVGRPRVLGRLSLREDDRRNVVVAIMERLYADDRRRLKGFVDAARLDPSRRFWPWLVVVARRVAIDYIRGHHDYIGGRGGPTASQPGWAHDTTASDGKLGGQRPPATMLDGARRLFALAADKLTDEQRRALELWLCGWEHPAIADELGLAGGGDAAKLVRAGLARLRRAVREEEA